jgi:polyhydroxyalkanoate synthase
MGLGEILDLRRRARALAERGLDATPKREVAGEGKWAVRGVSGDGGKPAPASAPPVLLMPPFMVRPLVFDLQPDHSLVRVLRDRGVPTYVLDLGVPDRTDRDVRLDDYVLEVVPRAVAAVRADAGVERISLFGYCMGGLFALIHAALHESAEGLHRIVTVGTPVDFSRMGVVGRLGRWAAGKVDPVVDAMGVVPGWMADAGFQLLSGRRALGRLLALRDREGDEAYLRSYGAMSRWLEGLVPYPAEAFKQFLREVMAGNRVHGSALRFGERVVDLSAVRAPVLSFAGEADAVASVGSVVAIRRHLPAGRASVRVVPGGHVGILGGPEAPRAVWHPAAAFLGEPVDGPAVRAADSGVDNPPPGR